MPTLCQYRPKLASLRTSAKQSSATKTGLSRPWASQWREGLLRNEWRSVLGFFSPLQCHEGRRRAGGGKQSALGVEQLAFDEADRLAALDDAAFRRDPSGARGREHRDLQFERRADLTPFEI